MSADLIVRPDEAELEAEVGPVMRAANALIVQNVEQQRIGLSMLADIRRTKKVVQRRTADFVEQTHKAWKAAVAFRSSFTDPLEEADELVSKKCAAFEKQQRDAAEVERKARLAEALERQEQARQMDAAMAESPEAAEEALTAPLPEPIVEVAPDVAKVGGVSARKIWRADVFDFEKFARGCIERGDFYLLEANMAALNQRAKNEHETLDIPGVRAVAEVGYAVR